MLEVWLMLALLGNENMLQRILKNPLRSDPLPIQMEMHTKRPIFRMSGSNVKLEKCSNKY